MIFRREGDGSYHAGYDGSKEDLLKLIKHFKDISHAGVGSAGISLSFQGLKYPIESARELYFLALGMTAALDTPFVLKMEGAVKDIVRDVFKLDDAPYLSPSEFSGPEEEIR